jgi:phosphoribosylformylglycinamidine cyclo-ligase
VDEGIVKGLAHITGGGISDNTPRILPPGARARVMLGSWPVLPVYDVIQKEGRVEEGEMYRVFNMGIGMIAVVAPPDALRLETHLDNLGEKHYRIGEIVKGQPGVEYARA